LIKLNNSTDDFEKITKELDIKVKPMLENKDRVIKKIENAIK